MIVVLLDFYSNSSLMDSIQMKRSQPKMFFDNIVWCGVIGVLQSNYNEKLTSYGRTQFARLNLHSVAALNCRQPLRLPP